MWRNGYKVFGSSCGDLANWLEMYHPGGETVMSQNLNYYEPETSYASRAERQLSKRVPPGRQPC